MGSLCLLSRRDNASFLSLVASSVRGHCVCRKECPPTWQGSKVRRDGGPSFSLGRVGEKMVPRVKAKVFPIFRIGD
uniref:Putative secreted protein n=1 Tax=Ixodes ricinus TaxID=34613 RepID=A0A6B0TTX4_IXORI